MFSAIIRPFKIIIGCNSSNDLIPRGPGQVSAGLQTHSIITCRASRNTRVSRLLFLAGWGFLFAGREWKIDGIALCQPRAARAERVPADRLRLLCSKKGNYNVNVSQQESEPAKRGRQRLMERTDSLRVNRETASGERLISNTHTEGGRNPRLDTVRLLVLIRGITMIDE